MRYAILQKSIALQYGTQKTMGTHTLMQRDIVYRNIAAAHIACDTEGMLHVEISHGNFIIFDAFLVLQRIRTCYHVRL